MSGRAASFMAVLAAVGLCGFLAMLAAAFDLVPHAFDARILLALRQAADPGQPIGPAWLHGAMRDVTALGSTVVLVFLTAATVVCLWIAGRRNKALLMLCAMAGGQVLGALVKLAVDRPRPTIVPHLVMEKSLSFPSGHAMMSAIAYLTLAMLAAQALPSRAAKVCVLALGVLTTLSVGASRLYLGVHWPSDVLAGWCLGAAWTMLCWLAARLLQRRKIENIHVQSV